ncbi:MAG: GTPase Era [Campylobacteraceae bacterium]
MIETKERAGFVAVVGKPNAGKSSLLNWLVDEKIAMVSKKANATRKRANVIVMHKDTQFIFVDTPGIHEKERVLNKFMLEESLKAMGDCDLILFLVPITDSIKSYQDFLALHNNKPHVVLLTKCDNVGNKQILEKLSEYNTLSANFKEIIPISIKHNSNKKYLLDSLEKYIPIHPFLFDPEILTTQMSKEIYKEYIREAIFQFTSDEVPYSSNVIIDKVEENEHIDNIFATIIVEKESQKAIVIGKDAATLKRIGKYAREEIEKLTNKQIFLKIYVFVDKNWTKSLKKIKNV